jgi:hypothetical protein
MSIGIGISGIIAVRRARCALRRFRRLPVSTAQDIMAASIGAEAVIEGVISALNPAQLHTLVVYADQINESESTFSGGNGRELKTSPLLLETPDGVVQIANSGYALVRPLVCWEQLQSSRSKRYVGFVPGNQVTVLGRIVDNGAGRAIEAGFLFGGAPADYPVYQRGIIIDGWIRTFVGGIGGLLLLFLGVGMFLFPLPE